MNMGSGDSGFNGGDLGLIFVTMGIIPFVIYQFRVGEASGKGGWVKKSEHPKRFAFMMGGWIFLAILFVIVSMVDIYARIHHLPRS